MNQYLEKIALRRVISEIAKGNVTMPVKELAEKGFIKSRGTYAKGMAEGNKAIASRIPGVTVNRARSTSEKTISSMGGGFSTHPRSDGSSKVLYQGGGAQAHPALGTEDTKDVTSSAMIRHELFEAQDIHKLHRQNRLNFTNRRAISQEYLSGLKNQGAPAEAIHDGRVALVNAMRSSKVANVSNFKNEYGQIVGRHATPRVLSQESEMIRKNPYLSKLKDYRVSSGEASITHDITGRRFGMDKMTGKHHERAFNANPHDYLEYAGTKYPVFEAK